MGNSHKKFELSPKLKLGVGRGYSQSKAIQYATTICLLLAAGLTVNAVRLAFFKNLTTTSAESLPQVLGVTDTRSDTVSQPTVQYIEYKVQKGDTLFNVSQNHSINWTTLATLNNLKSPFTLKPGQIIKIPR